MKKPQIRVKVYPVLCTAVESGVNYGYRRAYKHTDKPSEDAIKQAIIDAVLSELSEALEFDE